MRIRRFFVGLAALVLGAAGLGAVALAGAAPASAATGCSVAYSVTSQWSTGFGVAITITNLGSSLTSLDAGLLLRRQPAAVPGLERYLVAGRAERHGGQRVLERLAGHRRQRGGRRQLQLLRHQHQPDDVHPERGGLHRPGHRRRRHHHGQPDLAERPAGQLRHHRHLAVGGSRGNVTVTTSRTSGNTGLTRHRRRNPHLHPRPTTPPRRTVTITADSVKHRQRRPSPPAADRVPGGRRHGDRDVDAAAAEAPAPQLHVSGNKLVNAAGQQVMLHGVDRSGTEYACVQGNGIFDGRVDQAAVTAMQNWGVNAVRVPLNEACWNAESYVTAAYAGHQLHQRDQVLRQPAERQRHRGDPGPALDRRRLHRAVGRLLVGAGDLPEADARRGAGDPVLDARWPTPSRATTRSSSTCSTSRTRPAPTTTTGQGWQCWVDGGTCTGISYPVAGMQRWSTRSAPPAPTT